MGAPEAGFGQRLSEDIAGVWWAERIAGQLTGRLGPAHSARTIQTSFALPTLWELNEAEQQAISREPLAELIDFEQPEETVSRLRIFSYTNGCHIQSTIMRLEHQKVWFRSLFRTAWGNTGVYRQTNSNDLNPRGRYVAKGSGYIDGFTSLVVRRNLTLNVSSTLPGRYIATVINERTGEPQVEISFKNDR